MFLIKLEVTIKCYNRIICFAAKTLCVVYNFVLGSIHCIGAQPKRMYCKNVLQHVQGIAPKNG